MPIEDAEIAQTMERMFRRQRIATMTSTTVKSVTLAGERCRVEIEGKKGAEVLECDMVLSAVGIKSNIENLGLEQVGIKVERDKIVVDDNYRTSVEGVYAVGDIIATPALAHTATAEARHCVDAILGGTPAKVDYRAIPSCVFTAPEVASVGTTERQVAAEGVEYFVGRFQFAASGKAMAAGERDGFIKLIFDAKHRLTGAHLVGAHVTEILGEPTIAVALGTTAEELAHTVHAHPTLHEGVAEAAADALHQIAVAAKEPCKA